MYCPKLDKECVREECVAYKSLPSLLKCQVCGVQFIRGSSCPEDGHRRIPSEIKENGYCKEYCCEI